MKSILTFALAGMLAATPLAALTAHADTATPAAKIEKLDTQATGSIAAARDCSGLDVLMRKDCAPSDNAGKTRYPDAPAFPQFGI